MTHPTPLIDPMARPPQASAVEEASALKQAACPNCSAPLAQPQPRFCGDCGQETRIRPPRVSEFFQQFGGAYFATEGALWRTLKLLVMQPGELTRQYLAGRRKHYVLPLRLYLSISVLFFLLLGLLNPVVVQVDASKAQDGTRPKAAAQFSIDLGDTMRAGKKDGKFYCTGFPNWLCQRLQRRLDLEPEAMTRELSQVGSRMVANIPNTMFVLLPSFALWLLWVYRSRRMRYTEHLVFALHLHAFWFLVLCLTLADSNFLTVLAIAAIPIYALLAMRRVYGGRTGTLLLRGAALSALHLSTLVAVLVLSFFWSALF